MCARLTSLTRKLEALLCAPPTAPLATLSLSLASRAGVAHMNTTLDVDGHTHLVRRAVVLDARVQNVVMELPAGLRLQVTGVDVPVAEVLTKGGETLEYSLAGGGGEEYIVLFDVSSHGLAAEGGYGKQAIANEVALYTHSLIAGASLSSAVMGGSQVVSLEAMEHHLSQLDAMLLRLDRLTQRLVVGVAASADSPHLHVFGGPDNYVLGESRLPTDAPLVPVIQEQVLRVEGALRALGSLRLDADGGALSTVSARHFAGEQLGVFSRNVDGLMQRREAIAKSLLHDRTRGRMQTRVAYHELLSMDAVLREHVLEVCGCRSDDYALQRQARMFELRQLQANNVGSADTLAPEIFAETLASLQTVSAPPHAASVSKFAAVMTRGLLAAALLRSLQRSRFEIATGNSFVYRPSRRTPRIEDSHDGSSDLQFLLDKIRTDTRHEIIPAVLGAHIVRVLLQACNTSALSQQAERVVGIFADDLQPLVRSSLLGETYANTYGFLQDLSARTGYKAAPTSELVFDILCT